MTKTSFFVSLLGGASLCLTMYSLASLGRFSGWCAAKGLCLPRCLRSLVREKVSSGEWSKGIAFASAWSIHPGLSATLFGAIGLILHAGLGVPAVASLYMAMVGSLLLTLGIATLSWQKLFEPAPVKVDRTSHGSSLQNLHHVHTAGHARCDHQAQELPFVSLGGEPMATLQSTPAQASLPQKKRPCVCSPESLEKDPAELEV